MCLKGQRTCRWVYEAGFLSSFGWVLYMQPCRVFEGSEHLQVRQLGWLLLGDPCELRHIAPAGVVMCSRGRECTLALQGSVCWSASSLSGLQAAAPAASNMASYLLYHALQEKRVLEYVALGDFQTAVGFLLASPPDRSTRCVPLDPAICAGGLGRVKCWHRRWGRVSPRVAVVCAVMPCTGGLHPGPHRILTHPVCLSLTHPASPRRYYRDALCTLGMAFACGLQQAGGTAGALLAGGGAAAGGAPEDSAARTLFVQVSHLLLCGRRLRLPGWAKGVASAWLAWGGSVVEPRLAALSGRQHAVCAGECPAAAFSAVLHGVPKAGVESKLASAAACCALLQRGASYFSAVSAAGGQSHHRKCGFSG